LKDRARWNGQAQQKRRFAITKQVAVADDEIAQQEQHEEKREQQEQKTFYQERAQARKLQNDVLEAEKEKPISQDEVTGNESDDDCGQQARMFA
jgi:hypothetical protein